MQTEHVTIPSHEEGERKRSIVVYYFTDDLINFMTSVQKGIMTNISDNP